MEATETHFLQSVKFTGRDKAQFFGTVRKRVNQYFKDNDISRNGNYKMYIKTVVLLSAYFVPFALILTGGFGTGIIMGLYFIMGVSMACIGMGLMHDANHGSYSANPKVNKILGYSINFIGGNAANWKVQHNVLHHTYTNVQGMDHDLDGGPWLRFSPTQKHHKIHKYQHIYAFFLYGFLTLSWSLPKDFIQLKRYYKLGLRGNKDEKLNKDLITVAVSKILYFGGVFGLPIFVFDISWVVALLGFVVMHFMAGLILSVIFQLAHVVGEAEYFEENNAGEIDNNFAVHQMRTTANFATSSKFWTWFSGGLNHQVEHHMFPNICHVHYMKLSKIVKDTAAEFDVPYNESPTIWGAIASHIKLLKKFGQGEGDVIITPSA